MNCSKCRTDISAVLAAATRDDASEKGRIGGPVRMVDHTATVFLNCNGQEIWTSFDKSQNLIRHTTVAAVKHIRSFSQWLLARMTAGFAFQETSASIIPKFVGCRIWLCLTGTGMSMIC